MATRRQPLAFGWLLPGLTAAIVLVVVALAASMLLSVPAGAQAEEAAKLLMAKMGFEDVLVAQAAGGGTVE